jgi:hypothetical protein
MTRWRISTIMILSATIAACADLRTDEGGVDDVDVARDPQNIDAGTVQVDSMRT